MEVLDLARLQFAMTGSVHFLFVVLTLGMAPMVAVMQTKHLVTGKPVYEGMTRFWGQIYVINYALGIMTGLVMEFQFGMNWSGLSHFAGDVFGGPLAIETLVAFFLESTFLGLWIFGWHKLPPRLHLACIWMVAFTAYLSAFWIMVANSYLQNPVGSELRDGRLVLTDFPALLTNPTFVAALPHVIGAGVLTGGCVVAGASAYRLFRRPADEELFKRSLRTGLTWAGVGALLSIGSGYAQIPLVMGVQPGKFDGEGNLAATVGFGFMILLAEMLALLILVMVIVVARVHRLRWTHPLIMLMAPVPFLIAILGWLAREIGRQPWAVYGKLTTADAITPGLSSGTIIASLVAFPGLLLLLAAVDYLLILKAIRREPGEVGLGRPPDTGDEVAAGPLPPHRAHAGNL
ncbi:cytochrome ubiquinol oxidase subunit I [Sinosporangium siamense]|uniref:Cytochrome ubiquinol oxidase subunit I n=1 Tax=Sinosporangium siamense TaxID=1367973 RepID=A0A919VD36_9ACTN|nr:cytochrome ubiquinol oxidase subunit I [Sinosporangium siamense]GII93739.1 cytochrome ubiquinol oxidase subunit I [Sinosporangium siamense]